MCSAWSCKLVHAGTLLELMCSRGGLLAAQNTKQACCVLNQMHEVQAAPARHQGSVPQQVKQQDECQPLPAALSACPAGFEAGRSVCFHLGHIIQVAQGMLVPRMLTCSSLASTAAGLVFD
jgi:hypothetical protein